MIENAFRRTLRTIMHSLECRDKTGACSLVKSADQAWLHDIQDPGEGQTGRV